MAILLVVLWILALAVKGGLRRPYDFFQIFRPINESAQVIFSAQSDIRCIYCIHYNVYIYMYTMYILYTLQCILYMVKFPKIDYCFRKIRILTMLIAHNAYCSQCSQCLLLTMLTMLRMRGSEVYLRPTAFRFEKDKKKPIRRNIKENKLIEKQHLRPTAFRFDKYKSCKYKGKLFANTRKTLPEAQRTQGIDSISWVNLFS